jgi:hypothetical protein
VRANAKKHATLSNMDTSSLEPAMGWAKTYRVTISIHTKIIMMTKAAIPVTSNTNEAFLIIFILFFSKDDGLSGISATLRSKL